VFILISSAIARVLVWTGNNRLILIALRRHLRITELYNHRESRLEAKQMRYVIAYKVKNYSDRMNSFICRANKLRFFFSICGHIAFDFRKLHFYWHILIDRGAERVIWAIKDCWIFCFLWVINKYGKMECFSEPSRFLSESKINNCQQKRKNLYYWRPKFWSIRWHDRNNSVWFTAKISH